jgi:hypothetical protein
LTSFLCYLQIDGATVKTEEKSLEISLKSKSGVSVVVKTENLMIKQVWANAFEAQIEVLANKVASAARSITAEEKALTFSLNLSRNGCQSSSYLLNLSWHVQTFFN